MTKVVVGTGWWADHEPHAWAIGTQQTRTPEFFALWYALVTAYLAPHRIVVTDSHAPLKPPHRDKPEVVWIELDQNYGHANDIRVGRLRTKHSGFTRSVFLGAAYALGCDADYYVYLEQDCVIHGAGFLQAIVAGMEHPIALGAPTIGGTGIDGPAAPMVQQSLIVVRKDGLDRFIAGILLASESDGDVPPEVKFARDLQPFSLIPIPFGRSRPLYFTVPTFYAQHLTDAELAAFLRFEGMRDCGGASSPSAASASPPVNGRTTALDDLSVAYPAVREVVRTFRRRADLRDTFPEAEGGDVAGLLRWALVHGVDEEPALAELTSEIAAVAGRGLGEARPRTVTPRKVHIVSLAGFPESFRNCARSLHRGLVGAGVLADYHEDVPRSELGTFADVAADEVVHVTGQDPVPALRQSPARNWLLTIHGAANFALPPDLHAPPGPELEELRRHAGEVPHVICPSFGARREISRVYGLSEDVIDPVPHFFDPEVFRPDGDRPESDRYFLLVSHYQPKKNYVAVLESFHLLASRLGTECPTLTIAGEINEPLSRLVEDATARWPSLNGKVALLGHVDDLASVYRGALAVVSMSHHEGFGMPYIEAALCGVPVVGPARSVRAAAWASQPTRELLGGAAMVVDPQRPEHLATIMRLLWSDDALRTHVAARCRARAAAYVEPGFLVHRYLHVYGKVLAGAAGA